MIEQDDRPFAGLWRLHRLGARQRVVERFELVDKGFAVAPGGIGTLDELFEAFTLAQTGKITRFPLVLLGTKEWSGLVAWLRETVVADGRMSREDLAMVTVTDDVDEAVELFVKAREMREP